MALPASRRGAANPPTPQWRAGISPRRSPATDPDTTGGTWPQWRAGLKARRSRPGGRGRRRRRRRNGGRALAIDHREGLHAAMEGGLTVMDLYNISPQWRAGINPRRSRSPCPRPCPCSSCRNGGRGLIPAGGSPSTCTSLLRRVPQWRAGINPRRSGSAADADLTGLTPQWRAGINPRRSRHLQLVAVVVGGAAMEGGD